MCSPTGAALILESGFDSAGQFYHLPIHDTARLAECLRQRTIGLFLKLGLITQPFAELSPFPISPCFESAGELFAAQGALSLLSLPGEVFPNTAAPLADSRTAAVWLISLFSAYPRQYEGSLRAFRSPNSGGRGNRASYH